ncbi:unnamed protein product, partial [marine sediment metagenome]
RLYLVVSKADSRDLVVVNKYEPGSIELTTDTWSPGVFFEQSYDVGLPGPVEPGKYLLSVGVIDEEGPVAPTDPQGIGALSVPVTYLQVTD